MTGPATSLAAGPNPRVAGARSGAGCSASTVTNPRGATLAQLMRCPDRTAETGGAQPTELSGYPQPPVTVKRPGGAAPPK